MCGSIIRWGALRSEAARSIRLSLRLRIVEGRSRRGADTVGPPAPMSTPLADYGNDPLSGFGWILVLPESQHRPSVPFERRRRRSISMAVCFYFVGPIAAIRRWLRPMDRTSMPEAAVHEDSHSALRKQDIGPDRPTAGDPDWEVHAKAKPCAVQGGPQCELGAAVAAPVGSHDLPTQRRHIGPRSPCLRGFAHPPTPTLSS